LVFLHCPKRQVRGVASAAPFFRVGKPLSGSVRFLPLPPKQTVLYLETQIPAGAKGLGASGR
jgi:hypothetical protein